MFVVVFGQLLPCPGCSAERFPVGPRYRAKHLVETCLLVVDLVEASENVSPATDQLEIWAVGTHVSKAGEDCNHRGHLPSFQTLILFLSWRAFTF
eukprot:650365-Pelagomonas_calceolata.AAC.1